MDKTRLLVVLDKMLLLFQDMQEAITDKETAQDCPIGLAEAKERLAHLEKRYDRDTAFLNQAKDSLQERIKSLNKELDKVRMERDAAQRTLIAIKNMSINANIS